MDIRRVFEDRKSRPELGEGELCDSLHARGVNPHAGGAEAAVEQDLSEGSSEGVTHDDRRSIEPADDLTVVIHDFFDTQMINRAGVGTKLLDVDVHSRPRGGQHAVAAGAVAIDPMLPTQRRHPKPVDKDDRVR